MKKSKGIIIFLIICCVFLVVGMVLILTGHFHFSSFQNVLLEEKVYQDPIQSLIVEGTMDNIEIEQTDQDKVEVQIYGNEKERDYYKINLEDQELVIKKEGNSFCFGFCWVTSKIVVKVPKAWNMDLHLQTTSGNIEAKGEYNAIKLNSSSGSITLEKAKEAIISATSGNIHFQHIINGNITTSSGSIKGDYIERVSATATSGNITIEEVNGKAEVKTSSGSIKLHNFHILESSKLRATSGNIKISSDSNVYFNTKSNSGSIDVKYSERKSEIECMIETTSGSIRVS